ncbi:MAG: GNAT family N-acetyltransferase [Acidimicrobiales bacterium]
MVVRTAVVSDAAAMGSIHVVAWRAAYRGMMPDDFLDELDASQRADFWGGAIASPGQARNLVAVLDGDVVAMATIGPHRDGEPDEPTGELWSLNAHPDAWGSGAATALHHAAVAQLGADHDHAILWVVDANARARRFYEREGWVPDGATKTDMIGDASINEVRYRRRVRVP